MSNGRWEMSPPQQDQLLLWKPHLRLHFWRWSKSILLLFLCWLRPLQETKQILHRQHRLKRRLLRSYRQTLYNLSKSNPCLPLPLVRHPLMAQINKTRRMSKCRAYHYGLLPHSSRIRRGGVTLWGLTPITSLMSTGEGLSGVRPMPTKLCRLLA